MLAQRRRPNIKTSLFQCVVFAGVYLCSVGKGVILYFSPRTAPPPTMDCCLGVSPERVSSRQDDDSGDIKAGLCNADPITKQGKRIQMVQMMGVLMIPITLLVIEVGCKSSKHEALIQCWVDVGPASTTLGQHQPNIGLMPRVQWESGYIITGQHGTLRPVLN